MGKFSFQDWGVHKIAKKKKNHGEHFLQSLMLNISSITELLHKPSEIQWDITKTLPGKLKGKISWALSYMILPLKSQKCEKLLFLGVVWRPGNQCGIPWFFMILWISEKSSLYLLVRNSFNFKLFFFSLILNKWYHQKKHFTFRLPVIFMQKRAEKPSTNFTLIFFSMCHCEFFIVMSIYGSNRL